MTALQWLTSGLLILTLVLQAIVPSSRLLVVTTGALLSGLATALGGGHSMAALFQGVPWDVLTIVVVLGLFSEFLAESRAFGLLAVAMARLTRARSRALSITFVVAMYAVSGVVNNLTALLLVLPVMLSLLKLLGTTRRFMSWTLGAVLVACNLGGAATPVGDFPAILLLGRGAMGFSDYLVRAFPQTLVALVIFGVAVAAVRPARGLVESPLQARLALATVTSMHRNVRLDRRIFVPGLVCLAAMVTAWVLVPASTMGPEVIAWAGAAALWWTSPRLAERLLRTRVDAEAVLFLLALFVLVGAVRAAGTFELAGEALIALPLSPKLQVVVFLIAAAVLTGLFSAGPGMAALLDVAERLARHHPPAAIYVGLAMAVCAGSSLFLTAATSGPLTQSLTERANVQLVGGGLARFGFVEFLPVGILGFVVILGTGITFALFTL